VFLPGRAPQFVGDIAGGMKREGQKVEGGENGGQALFAVAEIVFDVVAFGFQYIECLIFDFPSGTTAGGQFGDIVGADRKISDEAIAIGDGAAGVENLDLEPVDLQGIVAVAQRDILDPTVTVDDFDLTALDRFFVALKIDPGDVFLDQGMRGRLADEDEMPVDGADGLAQGLAGEQIVAEIDRAKPGVVRPVGRQPPLRSGVLTVLFFRAILRGNEFWFERDDLVVPGSDQSYPQHRVEILLLALAALPGRAIVSMDVLGAEILGPVEGDQHMVSQPLERLQAALQPFQDRDRIGED